MVAPRGARGEVMAFRCGPAVIVAMAYDRRRDEALASVAAVAPGGRVRPLASADDAGPAAELHVRERPPGGVLLRRAGQDLRPHLGVVRDRPRHLRAPLGD